MTDYTGSTGYGEKFSQDIQFDPLEGPANDINEAADSAIRRFRFIDASRQVAGGASYGGPLTQRPGLAPTTHPPPGRPPRGRGIEKQWGARDLKLPPGRKPGG